MSSYNYLSRVDIFPGIMCILITVLVMALITYFVDTFNKPTENFNRRGCDGSIVRLRNGNYEQDIYVPW